MAITTYSELLSATAGWLHRSDLTANIPDFVALLEATLQRELNTADVEASTTLTLSAGSATVALPTGFTKLRRLRLRYGDSYEPLSVISLAGDAPQPTVTRRPTCVAVQGSNLIFDYIADQAYSLPMDYYAKFTPLSDSAPSNWILANHPDCYLYGTLAHAVPFLGADPRGPAFEGAFSSAMGGIIKADRKKRFSKLKTRTNVPVTSHSTYDVRVG